MARFHMNTSSGEAGVCRAKQGKCPFGGDEVHFTTADAARAFYEESMDTSNTVNPSEVHHGDVISLINEKTGERIIDEDVNFTGYNNLIRVPSGSPTNGVESLVEHHGWRIYKRVPAKPEAEVDNGPALPELKSLYKSSPRAVIGIKRIHGLLNGIQDDLDAKFISQAEAKARIAAVVIRLEAAEKTFHSREEPNVETVNRLAFIEDLKKLSGGAQAAPALNFQPAWGQVYQAGQTLIFSGKLDKQKDYALKKLNETLRGEPYLYQGAGDTRTLKLANELEALVAKARKPELVNLHQLVTNAIAIDGRSA